MKPWREIAVPHPDVLAGAFLQSEFAADITAVHTGKATREYQDAAAFFARTFITEGMRLLLTSVIQRLNGKGGEPVIQLQTAFGGGKTHTMLAVYHLAKRQCPLQDLLGIPDMLDRAGIFDVPKAHVAVLDGNALAPGQPCMHGDRAVNTLWGELAWQLGGEEGYELVRKSDQTGTSPGKETLRVLLETYAPCVLLVDELVAYIRQFKEGQRLSGGSYDSNLSFVQALTEAVKLAPTAIMLASLPESEVEAGSNQGLAALQALEKTFGRLQSLWKPVAAEEAFEIVRRRLFEPIRDDRARDEVCRAFADAYVAEGVKMPSETQETRYLERLTNAYPIHPEVFDRLYQDWTTLEGFQRTRGVLKLMAKVIYHLWQDQNKDLMIMPGSLPLHHGDMRNELIYYLAPGWDAVIDKDIDGDRSETLDIERKETRFGAINAAHYVARTIFFGSAPSSSGSHKGVKGVDRAHVLLGCLQPGQSSSIFVDALNRLADRLHYLNSTGDKSNDATRFWFDTRANLRREMEERKSRFEDMNEVRAKIKSVLEKLAPRISCFDGIHIFTPHGDVPDDSALRLVFLPLDSYYSKQEPEIAEREALTFLRSNGQKPRYRSNRLLFVAPDQAALIRLRDCVRTALAWNSIVEDVKEGRLNIDRLQENQARHELQSAENVLPHVTRECCKWLLCPEQSNPMDSRPAIKAYPINISFSEFGAEIERVCTENELIISAWSPIHLRDELRKFYWKNDRTAVRALDFWEDSLRYVYLPRLRSQNVLEHTIIKGAGVRDFFGTAYGMAGGVYEGFIFGNSNVQMDDTLLLIDPEYAKQYEASLIRETQQETYNACTGDAAKEVISSLSSGAPAEEDGFSLVSPPAPQKSKEFIGSVEIPVLSSKLRLIDVSDEIISILASDPQANITITLEIRAEFPTGASDQVKRGVSENATMLNFKNHIWE